MGAMDDDPTFWDRVDRSGGPDACWPWIPPCTHKSGYGQLGWRGEARTAPSVAVELATGVRPNYACHRCDNPPCCNPRHLYDGTARTNMEDRDQRGRNAHGARHWSALHPDKIVANERHGMARLTDAQVAEIRDQRAAGVPRKVVAATFGISETHVKRITSGRSRKPSRMLGSTPNTANRGK